ncbi:MAG: hypothetical protein EOM85_03665 [Candidatus Moranbacteria bacterium]|nr:hypothetical protein [Candidatus Moranbacteria bacterium]
MKKVMAVFTILLLSLLLITSCRTVDQVTTEKIVVPDITVFRYNVYEYFPLIKEPQTDSDLMYNSLVIEMSDAITNEYADMLEEFNKSLESLLNK